MVQGLLTPSTPKVLHGGTGGGVALTFCSDMLSAMDIYIGPKKFSASPLINVSILGPIMILKIAGDLS